ncbi:MAG: translation initiation factor IF-2 [Bacillaceae bacterium]|nr:translation initiation factor IF-2 [Bacillaceae bacterium]
MSKMRVYQYAKQMNMSSKEILNILKRLNIEVSNHMSVLDSDTIEKIEKHMENLKNRAEQKTEQSRKESGQNKSGGASRHEKKKDGEARPAQGKDRERRPERTKDKKRAQNTRSGDNQQRNKPSAAQHETRGKGKKKNQPDKRTQDRSKKQDHASGKKQQQKKEQPKKQTVPEKIEISGTIQVGELAKLLNKDTSEVIKKLMSLGVMATINQEIDMDVITLIADEYGVEVEEKVLIDERNFEEIADEDDPKSLVPRPPVVTIMGHVDHGKTTLLDAIRESNVIAGEAGGITQHIGAYQVEVNDKKITFLDTPGHAAFTTMRSRGAQVTDITILVVAADDGVMPQTVEAINHARAAGVPIIVAVNKVDKPEANPDKIKQELTEHELVPEEWGGDTIFVPVSALKKEGLDELLEMILLVAEVNDYKANPDKRARGTVIEAELDRGRGPVATVLVQNGTLKIGDPIVVGTTYGRIRAMVNDRGRRIKDAPPSTPVEITGLNDVPQAGDQFMVFEDEKKARSIGEYRAMKRRESERNANTRVSLDDLFEQIKEGEMKELNVIIKADVQGSVEALKGALEKIDVEGVKVKIIHTGVGAITESDVILASASNAIIVGFNVRPEPNARATAESEKVDIRLHRIIYNVIEEIESAMQGMLDPEYEEKIIGQAEVRQTFKVSRIGTIAGCYVTEGKVTRDAGVRIIRDGVVIYEGKIDSLKRYKDDVKEAAQGYECGLTIENFNDIKEGDIIEAFVMETVAR